MLLDFSYGVAWPPASDTSKKARTKIASHMAADGAALGRIMAEMMLPSDINNSNHVRHHFASSVLSSYPAMRRYSVALRALVSELNMCPGASSRTASIATAYRVLTALQCSRRDHINMCSICERPSSRTSGAPTLPDKHRRVPTTSHIQLSSIPSVLDTRSCVVRSTHMSVLYMFA